MNLKLILLIVILAAVHSYGDETYSKNKRGNNLYKNQAYTEALKEYDDAILLSPSDSRLKMNKGSTHYQLGEFDKAEEAYNAALSSENKEQRADAHYNLGNIQFRAGAQMYQQGPQQALEKFKSAYDHYVKSLEIRPSDNDTKWNLQLAHHVMKQLEQQQQQQKNNKDNKNQNQVKPSENAKKIKAAADLLVSQGAYKRAQKIMNDLLQSDSTAVTYQDYIERLDNVVTAQ